MRPEYWSRAKEIFSQASSLSVERRRAFLLSACKGDGDLEAGVAALLESHDRAAQFLESPPLIHSVDLRGKALGPYRIDAKIGSGGMGDVYAARDTRLDRAVAIKVLPSDWAADEEWRARFEREARAVATLNHPHICTIHDTGNSDGIDYLVLELLDGETLAERLERGALPAGKALEIAIQIATALDAVHRAGIVHRDLKPGNVMLTKSGVKLLDFGNSKVPRIDLSRIGTLEANTVTGAGFGTVQYMAPELFAGKPADARSDVFAFGALLFEMMTGRRAFSGANAQAIVDAIASHRVERPDGISDRIARVIRTCLAHDADERWQSARDLARELTWIAEDRSQPAAAALHPSRSWNFAIGAIAAVAIAAAAYGELFRRAATPGLPAAFEIPTPASVDPTGFAISPDGRRLVFVAQSEGASKLWLRPLDRWDAQPLAGTDGATYPFWSPAGSQVAFFAGGKLRRIDIESGEVRTIADAPNGRGGSWNNADVIVYAPATAGQLLRVSASGGTPQPATMLASDQNSHRWPHFLPDNRRFLFLSTQARAGVPAVYAASLDSPEVTLVVEGDTAANFSPPDRLIFVQRGALVSAAVDPRTLKASGTPQPIIDNIGFDPNLSRGAFSISRSGALVYRSMIASTRQLVWVDRSGSVLNAIGPADAHAMGSPELSPDGRQIAFSRVDDGNADIWTIGTANGVPNRFTFDDSTEVFPIWTPDGASLLFMSSLRGTYNMYRRDLTRESESALFPDAMLRVPTSVSTDGRLLLFSVQQPETGVDIFALSLGDDGSVTPVVRTPFDEMAAQFSPDRKWIAYQSNSSGRMEVYVRTFDSGTLGQQVSTAGGSQPRWRRDGRELFYIAADGRMMAVEIAVNVRDGIEPHLPIPLFDPRLASGANIPPAVGTKAQYDVAADGRFLINTTVDQPLPPIRVSLDWRKSLAQ